MSKYVTSIKQEVETCLKLGMPRKSIAKLYGIGLTTISRISNGTRTDFKSGRRQKVNHDMLVNLAKQGDISVEIAEKMNMGPSTIRQYAKRHGIRIRKYSEHIADFLETA